jgi:acyl-coenzyme A thioesterase PaaI-like protein
MERISLKNPYPNCFGCGKENPIGLKLVFHRDGDRVVSEYTPTELFQGFPSIVHGGVACVLLDELMAWTLWASLGKLGFTQELQVFYKHPLRTRRKVVLVGRLEVSDSSTATVRGEIQHPSGLLYVEARAKFLLRAGKEKRT